MFSPNHKKNDCGQYYFVQREPGVTDSVRDQHDHGTAVETKPQFVVDEDAFTPKAVNRKIERGNSITNNAVVGGDNNTNPTITNTSHSTSTIRQQRSSHRSSSSTTISITDQPSGGNKNNNQPPPPNKKN